MCVVFGCATALWADSPLEALFRDPTADALRPCVALDLACFARDTEGLSRQLSHVRDLGAGGVLVRMPLADEAVWSQLSLISETCRRLGLELGVCDFMAAGESAVEVPRTQRLVWTMSRRDLGLEPSTNALPSVFQPGDSYRELARLAVPDEGEVLPHQIVDMKAGPAPTNGVWRLYSFGHADAVPPLSDCFDGKGVFRHVNQMLFAMQSRLPHAYGTTLQWCQMSGPGRCDWIWPRDFPEAFLRRSGVNVMRHLPALAGVAVGGETTAAYVRQQAGLTVRDLWREQYAVKVDELVHEAGLEAGIAVREAAVEPEEVALYFRRPTLATALTPELRAANVRAAGGARALGRRTVLGRLDCAQVSATPDQVLLPFFCKHEVDLLLSDGATRVLFELGGALPAEGERVADLRAACRYAHRCQVLLSHGEAVADFLVWSTEVPEALGEYACDAANGTLLAAASVKDGKIRFESDRMYGALALTAEALQGKAAERLVKQLAAGGVSLWLVTNGVPDEASAFAKLMANGVGHMLGEAGAVAPLPDLSWKAEVEGMQLRFLHRRSPECEIYFVVNASAVGGPVTCSFRDTGQGDPERWNPVSGETGLSVHMTRASDGRGVVPLFMAPHDACFVVFNR